MRRAFSDRALEELGHTRCDVSGALLAAIGLRLHPNISVDIRVTSCCPGRWLCRCLAPGVSGLQVDSSSDHCVPLETVGRRAAVWAV